MCCLVDAEAKGERGGFDLCRPLPDTLIHECVPVPGSGSGIGIFPIRGRSLQGPMVEAVEVTFFRQAIMKLDEKRVHLDTFRTRQWLVEAVDESRVG